MSSAKSQKGGFVVWADGPDGPVYLDDTGTGVLDIAQAKWFEGEAEVHAALAIAELAPTGADGPWHVKRVPRRGG